MRKRSPLSLLALVGVLSCGDRPTSPAPDVVLEPVLTITPARIRVNRNTWVQFLASDTAVRWSVGSQHLLVDGTGKVLTLQQLFNNDSTDVCVTSRDRKQQACAIVFITGLVQ